MVRKAVEELPTQMRNIILYSMKGLKNHEIAGQIANFRRHCPYVKEIRLSQTSRKSQRHKLHLITIFMQIK